METKKARRSTQNEIFMNFDGLCEPRNPGGVATFGVVIRRNGGKIFEESGLARAKPWSNEASNNVAEYSALIRGLEWLLEAGLNHSPIRVRGDSKLVVNQVKGVFKVKAPRIIGLYSKARELLESFDDLQVEWIDRSLNSEADMLSRLAYARFSKERANEVRS